MRKKKRFYARPLLMKMIYEKTGIGAVERYLGINSFEEAEYMADILRR